MLGREAWPCHRSLPTLEPYLHLHLLAGSQNHRPPNLNTRSVARVRVVERHRMLYRRGGGRRGQTVGGSSGGFLTHRGGEIRFSPMKSRRTIVAKTSRTRRG